MSGGAFRVLGLFCLVMALLAAVIASLSIGARVVDAATVWHALWSDEITRDSIVVRQLRAPRTALAVMVGAALGTAGALMQALTRNPLADPGLLGVNAGASLAVVVAIGWLGAAEFPAQIGAAMLGCTLAGGAVFVLGRTASAGQRAVHLVLTGAAVSATLRAMTGMITMSNAATFDSYRFWIVGGLGSRTEGAVWWVAPTVAAALAPALLLGSALNAMALGPEVAAALGARLAWVRALAFACIVVLCGAATAAAGPIAFAGLVVPSVVRLVLGPDWRWIMPYSVLTGALLLLAADIIGRVVARPGELEAGIVMAFVGAPVLLWLATRPARLA